MTIKTLSRGHKSVTGYEGIACIRQKHRPVAFPRPDDATKPSLDSVVARGQYRFASPDELELAYQCTRWAVGAGQSEALGERGLIWIHLQGSVYKA